MLWWKRSWAFCKYYHTKNLFAIKCHICTCSFFSLCLINDWVYRRVHFSLSPRIPVILFGAQWASLSTVVWKNLGFKVGLYRSPFLTCTLKRWVDRKICFLQVSLTMKWGVHHQFHQATVICLMLPFQLFPLCATHLACATYLLAKCLTLRRVVARSTQK